MKGSLLLFPYSFVQGSAYLRSSMIWVNEGYSGTWTEVVVSAPFEDRIARLGWIITSFNWGVFHVKNEQIIYLYGVTSTNTYFTGGSFLYGTE